MHCIHTDLLYLIIYRGRLAQGIWGTETETRQPSVPVMAMEGDRRVSIGHITSLLSYHLITSHRYGVHNNNTKQYNSTWYMTRSTLEMTWDDTERSLRGVFPMKKPIILSYKVDNRWESAPVRIQPSLRTRPPGRSTGVSLVRCAKTAGGAGSASTPGPRSIPTPFNLTWHHR